MRRLSLRLKMQALLALTLLGLGIAVVVAFGTLTNRELSRRALDDSRSAISLLRTFLKERRTHLETAAALIADLSAMRSATSSRDAKAVRQVVGKYLRSAKLDGLAVTDSRGKLLAEVGRGEGRKSDRSSTPGVKAAMSGKPWSNMLGTGNRLALGVAVPVRVGGRIKGTLTAYSAVDNETAKKLARTMGTNVAFVSNGRIVASSLPISGKVPFSQVSPSEVTLRGTKYLALMAGIPGIASSKQTGFVALTDISSVTASYKEVSWAFITALAIGFLIAVLLGGRFAHQIVRPLERVISAAIAVADGIWPEKFEVKTTDEVGVLQSAFNHMTASIKDTQTRLLAMIDTDPLTELENHRRFKERLAEAIMNAAESGDPVSILLIDIDEFQIYNQVHGHAVGDIALTALAKMIAKSVPTFATVARYGGEEIVVLLPHHELQQAVHFAETIRQRATCLEHCPRLTVSVGCSQTVPGISNPDSLMLAAELAVSRAKQLGRDRVCRWDSVPGADANSDPHQLQSFLKDGSLATIQALAAAVDAKDPYTQGHSQRVADYASSLASALQCSDSEVELVYRTGTLHDVGKIGVPDSILKKQGRLTDEERAVMETHPVLGDVIVRKVPQLENVLPGVRYHHERWDGKGYPDGLEAENIPRIARILALADTFDAMTSDRPYRKGMSWETALDEIAKGGGTQFDPSFAPVFVRLMQARMRNERRAA